MSPKHYTNRNDLFLVRFWREDMSDESEGQSGRCGWSGRVQRTVSGESYEFNDWDALVEVLRAMLAATSPLFRVDRLPETNNKPASGSGEKGEEQ